MNEEERRILKFLIIAAQREFNTHALSHKKMISSTESSKIRLFLSSQIIQKVAITEHVHSTLAF